MRDVSCAERDIATKDMRSRCCMSMFVASLPSPSVRLYGLSKVLDDDDRRRSSCVTCPIVVPPRLVPAGSGSLAHELRSSIMTLCTALFVLRCVVVQLPTDRHAPNPNQRTRATSHLAGGWRRGLLRRPCIRRVLCARTSRTSDVASRRPRTSRVGRDARTFGS